jgi:hypothetical protein
VRSSETVSCSFHNSSIDDASKSRNWRIRFPNSRWISEHF